MRKGILREEPIGKPLYTQFLKYHVQINVKKIPPCSLAN